ncbi:MAG TPA: putative manganese-dependent inorganic diphosphatase, partial [Candidatus Saccharimonadales bacterium]|nr:putative manganese-dependent inorganic diphosphatase [Candidatus Saccharimonadales bacterium]
KKRGDDAGRCQGMLSLFKLSKFLFPGPNRPFDSRRVLSSLRNLAQTLGGTLLVAHEAEQEEDLILTIGAMGLESFAERLEHYPREKLLVVVGDRWDIQNLAIRERVRAVVVTGGTAVEQKTVEAAQRNRVGLITCAHDTATTAALCRASIAVRHVVNENFETLNEESPLAEIKAAATASGYAAFPVLNSERRTVGILAKTDLLKKVDRRLILVDHNELSQAVQGAEQVEIMEIIDHHRIGALTTQQPILFRNEPVGSTSTIVADCFLRYGVELPPPIAGLLLAGLVSDTLNLTSPTATAQDAEVLRKLQEISGVNAREFTEKLFASGSLLTLKPAPQAITTDCKEYKEDGVRFSVAQIEEIGFDQFWKRKTELLEALENYRRKRDYLFSALLVTDVNTQSSLLALAGEKKLADRIDYPRTEPGVYELRGVVSRKKQLLPYLTHCLAQTKG